MCTPVGASGLALMKTELSEEKSINQKLNRKLLAMDKAMRKYEAELEELKEALDEKITFGDGVKSHALASLQEEYNKEKERAEAQAKELADLKQEMSKMELHVERLEHEHAAYIMTQGSLRR